MAVARRSSFVWATVIGSTLVTRARDCGCVDCPCPTSSHRRGRSLEVCLEFALVGVVQDGSHYETIYRIGDIAGVVVAVGTVGEKKKVDVVCLADGVYSLEVVARAAYPSKILWTFGSNFSGGAPYGPTWFGISNEKAYPMQRSVPPSSSRGAPGWTPLVKNVRDRAVNDTKLHSCEYGEIRVDAECHPCSSPTEYSLDPYEKSCRSCPKQASCDSDEADDFPGAVLILDKGYWRSSALSRNFRMCPFYEACTGGVDLWLRGTSCRRNHHGPMCAVCKKNFGLDRTSGVCVACSNRGKRDIVFALASIVGVVAGFGAAYVALKWMFPDLYDAMLRLLATKKIAAASFVETFGPMLRILYVFWQTVAAQYSSFLFVPYPRTFSRVARHLGATLHFNLYIAAAKYCRHLDHYDALVLSTLTPIGVLIAIAIVWKLCRFNRAANRGQLRKNASFSAFLLIYVVYAPTSSVILKTFRCDDMFRRDDGEPKLSRYRDKVFLQADYSLSCETRAYNWFRLYASLMSVVYVVGTPVLFFLVLSTKRTIFNPVADDAARDIIDDNQDAREYYSDFLRLQARSYLMCADFLEGTPDPGKMPVVRGLQRFGDNIIGARNRASNETAHLQFLFGHLNSSCWWFESFDCIRRLLLTSVLPMFYPRGEHLGLLYATFMIALVFFAVYLATRPFALDDVDRFAIVMQGALALILLLTICMFVEANLDRHLRGRWNREIIGYCLVLLSVFLGPLLMLFYASRDEDASGLTRVHTAPPVEHRQERQLREDDYDDNDTRATSTPGTRRSSDAGAIHLSYYNPSRDGTLSRDETMSPRDESKNDPPSCRTTSSCFSVPAIFRASSRSLTSLRNTTPPPSSNYGDP